MTFNSFHLKTLKYELCNKFAFKNISELPKLKKIILNFGCRTADLKHLSASLLALELITCQKGRITTTKSPNLLLKIKKGNPSGCKVTLKKTQMLNFLLKMIINVFPKIKNFDGFKNPDKNKSNLFSFKLNDTFVFKELEKNYYLFHKLKMLTVTIVLKCSLREELLFLLKSFQFPLNCKCNSNGRV